MKTFYVILLLVPLFLWQCETSPYRKLKLDSEEKAALHELLAKEGEQYDAEEKMLFSNFSSPGYHTTLAGGTVHRTRQSLTYAVSCLDSDDPELKQRGFDILDRVIDLQDQNPDSKTYGIWPWFLEEPLPQMSPPDWNWADFCGVQLLQAVIYHKEEFSPELLAKTNNAIYHAARSIEKRNVGPEYTNIAIMGTYVTMITAELQNLPDLKKYALDRLQRFYDYTMETGAFSEYNSPTYTIVALKELARMLEHFSDRRAKKLVKELYELAWEEIALHFHPPAQQWGGPHSRNYETLLPIKTLAFIQSSTSEAVSFGVPDFHDLQSHRLSCPCPKKLEHYFISIEKPRQVRRKYSQGDNPLVGTTYTTPQFSLGSINRGDFWNQRRPLILYWGKAANPSFLRVRFLHDGYDFAAAQFYSVQEKGIVLFGVALATDGGDNHVNLDRLKNAVFSAKDLRLRFEFGGLAAEKRVHPPRTVQDNLLLAFPGLDLRISIPWAAFDDLTPYWDGEKSGTFAAYDLVLYSGEQRVFDLSRIMQAGIAGMVAAGARTEMSGALRGTLQNDGYQIGYQQLDLFFPVAPAPKAELARRVKFD